LWWPAAYLIRACGADRDDGKRLADQAHAGRLRPPVLRWRGGRACGLRRRWRPWLSACFAWLAFRGGGGGHLIFKIILPSTCANSECFRSYGRLLEFIRAIAIALNEEFRS
jgi:hypothetical protein